MQAKAQTVGMPASAPTLGHVPHGSCLRKRVRMSSYGHALSTKRADEKVNRTP